ncbi:unnamed protein product, partial [Ixodes pacificus]
SASSSSPIVYSTAWLASPTRLAAFSSLFGQPTVASPTSLFWGSAARRRSEKALQRRRAASSNLSPESSSSIRAAIIFTSLDISGRVRCRTHMVVMAAPTAGWSTSSGGPAVRVTTWAVAAFMAAIWEVRFCLWVSRLCCFHCSEAGSLPSWGRCSGRSSSRSEACTASRPASRLLSSALWGSDGSSRTCGCCGG